MTEWQDISTAPRDGSLFLGFGSYTYPGDSDPTEYMEVASYSGDEAWPWRNSEGLCKPHFYSHWQPLPSPPNKA